MYEILNRISVGYALDTDLEMLLKLGTELTQLSNCGLGQAATVPIRDILKYFREEVEAHIHARVCPAGVCSLSAQPVLAGNQV
jgi:NADH:ubiquinone oxidoreductase subunit F (NADH-binding)